MLSIENIMDKIKEETNNISDIVYRKKIINKQTVYIIYNEPLASSDKISDFIIRSLNNISQDKKHEKNIKEKIINNIANFKVKELNNYKDICFYLNSGFTILLIENVDGALALETKADLSRSISTPDTENTLRGSKDSFVEDYQKNIGLIKKRIRSNDLWIDDYTKGKYTNTKIGILYINGVVKKELVDTVKKALDKVDISGIVSSDNLKNLIEKENKSVFPTIMTTERPDVVSNALLEGKVVIIVDNGPYALVLPAVLNDFFKTCEDYYGKYKNVSLTRIVKFFAFFISILMPSVYISLITYNQEMIPTELLVNFATQRDGVPFPAFFEAIIMLLSFEILRESDLRVPGFTGSSLSIVGALILGDAAVQAGIVSPIMIIVIAITAISSLPFSEPELINGLRWYRILFMIGASMLGIVGVVIVFIYFIIELSSLNSFGKPYLIPYAPTYIVGLKNSLVKFPAKSLIKRRPYLSNNTIRKGSESNEKN